VTIYPGRILLSMLPGHCKEKGKRFMFKKKDL